MIIALCEFGGERLLGKARELADASGDRVLGLVSSDSSREVDQKLIGFGADEVLICNTRQDSDWVGIIVSLVKKLEGQVKVVMFSSNLESNSIMGAIYSTSKDLFGNFLDSCEVITESSAAKQLLGRDYIIQKTLRGEKASLVSVRLSTLPPPFEDSSRFGKINRLEPSETTASSFSLLRSQSEKGIGPSFSSEELSVIFGRNVDEKTKELCEKIAKKYRGSAEEYSQRIDIVYGPCLAVEVYSKIRDLPDFQRELISISTAKTPLSEIADEVVVTKDELEATLEGLLG